MRETIAAAPPLAWSRAFPAVPAQIREARRFLAGVLAGCPAADDATLCLSELAGNATVHSHSRRPGGSRSHRARCRPYETILTRSPRMRPIALTR